jgi:CrcB protein
VTRPVAVFAGGAAGTTLRYAIARALPVAPGRWPVATLLVNIAGSLLLGLVVARVDAARWPERIRALLGAGFCGGLTTFSTYAVETVGLGRAHRPALAAGYAIASVACGLAAAWAGLHLGRAR